MPDEMLPDQSTRAKKLSALAAAVQVLGETGQPMNCPELIAAMAAKGYWSSPHGRTPAATLYSFGQIAFDLAAWLGEPGVMIATTLFRARLEPNGPVSHAMSRDGMQ
jgi:hypothetical protein